VRRVIVVDEEGKAVGVIGERDLLVAQGAVTHHHPLLALAEQLTSHLPEELFPHRTSQTPLSAQQLMRPRLVAVTPTTSISEAVQIMLTNRIKRLVVIDDEGKPSGMVDRQQLLHSLVERGSSRTGRQKNT
jgi:predicted transcriptional regulator